jgi:hypothetical protein
VQPFGQKVSAFLADPIDTQGLIVVPPQVNLIFQSALKTVEQQKVSSLFHSRESRRSSGRHATKFDYVGVFQRGQEFRLLQ